MAVQTEAQPSRTGFQLITEGPFARLWWAGLLSSTGDWVALFATLTLAARLGGANAETAILVPLVARLLPGLVFVAAGGVLADRFDRKLMMVISDIGRAVLVLSLAFVNNLPQLFVVSLVLELFTLLWQPSKEATLPNLVNKRDLATVNGLSLGAAYGTFPLGAGLIWLLDLLPDFGFTEELRAGPETLAFGVDALTFLASGLLITTIAIPRVRVSDSRRQKGAIRNSFRDMVDGFSFVAKAREVRPIVLAMGVGLFGGGVLFALGESYARRIIGTDQQGFYALLFALGTGAAIGIIGAAVLGARAERADVPFGLALVTAGISLLAVAAVKTIVGAMGWITLIGAGTGVAYVMGFSHLHKRVQDEYRGRTFAALIALIRTGLLASIAIAGVAATALDDLFQSPFDNGTRNVIGLGGLIVLTAGVLTLWGLRHSFGTTGDAIRSVNRVDPRRVVNGEDEAADEEDS